MRISVDSQIFFDARFRALADQLGVPLNHAIGACIALWMDCYQRREATAKRLLSNCLAGLENFSSKLVAVGLASDIDDDHIRVNGISDRIKWLQTQAEKGRKGGKAKAKNRALATAKQTPSKPLAYSITTTNTISKDLISATGAETPTKAKRKCRLPDGWQPNDKHRDKCKSLGIDCARQAERFADHHAAVGSLMADWDRAFHKWLNNAADWGQTNKPSQTTPPALKPFNFGGDE